MSYPPQTACIAFASATRIAHGSLEEVARAVWAHLEVEPHAAVLIFDEATSEPIELDLRGSLEEALARLPATAPPGAVEIAGVAPPSPPRSPGRPRLGVVAREVTLLPRHWEWLAGQPGGASVALRRLVEKARRTHEAGDRVRRAQEATYRFLSALGGDLPGYEEAIRALYAGGRERFEVRIADWPVDLREHATTLAAPAFAAAEPTGAS